jgi:hypothetical protein
MGLQIAMVSPKCDGLRQTPMVWHVKVQWSAPNPDGLTRQSAMVHLFAKVQWCDTPKCDGLRQTPMV